jgi:hypothetical protein
MIQKQTKRKKPKHREEPHRVGFVICVDEKTLKNPYFKECTMSTDNAMILGYVTSCSKLLSFPSRPGRKSCRKEKKLITRRGSKH